MGNWQDIAKKFEKANINLKEWREGAKDAEKIVAELRKELLASLSDDDLTPQSFSRSYSVSDEESELNRIPISKRRRRSPPDYGRETLIMNLFQERGGFLSTTETASALDCPSRLVASSFGRMANSGKVKRLSRGRYQLVSSTPNGVKGEA